MYAHFRKSFLEGFVACYNPTFKNTQFLLPTLIIIFIYLSDSYSSYNFTALRVGFAFPHCPTITVTHPTLSRQKQ